MSRGVNPDREIGVRLVTFHRPEKILRDIVEYANDLTKLANQIKKGRLVINTFFYII